MAASLSPDEALSVYEDLGEARKGLVLFNDLHLVFLVKNKYFLFVNLEFFLNPKLIQVTPIYLQWPGSISWYDFYQQSWCRMTPEYRTVGDRVGLKDGELLKLAHGGTLSRKPEENNRKLAVNSVQRKKFSPFGSNISKNENLKGGGKERGGEGSFLF